MYQFGVKMVITIFMSVFCLSTLRQIISELLVHEYNTILAMGKLEYEWKHAAYGAVPTCNIFKNLFTVGIGILNFAVSWFVCNSAPILDIYLPVKNYYVNLRLR